MAESSYLLGHVITQVGSPSGFHARDVELRRVPAAQRASRLGGGGAAGDDTDGSAASNSHWGGRTIAISWA